jgi:hypothetical protein
MLVADAENALAKSEVLGVKIEGSEMSLGLLTLSDVEALPSVALPT